MNNYESYVHKRTGLTAFPEVYPAKRYFTTSSMDCFESRTDS